MDGGIVTTKPSSINVAAAYNNGGTSKDAQPTKAQITGSTPEGADVDSWRGWLVVAGSFFVHMWSVGLTYAFGVFVLPLQHEFRVHRESIIWSTSLMRFVLLLSGVGTGYLADRWSYTYTALIGSLLLVTGLELSSIITRLWHQYLTFSLIGLGGGFCFIPAVAVISEWFQLRRGLATGVAMAGTGVGNLLIPLGAQPLINRLGWRWALRVLGFAALCFLLPSALTIRRRTTTKRRRYRFVGRDVVLTRTFLFLGTAIFFFALAFLIPIVNCVPNAVDKHIKLPQVLLAANGAAAVIGRVGLGFVSDWIGKVSVLKLTMLTMAVSTPFWPFVVNFWQNLIFSIVYGLAAGSFNALLAPTAGDYFGTKSIAGVAGIIYALCAFGNLIGPPMSARMYDEYRDYFAAAMFSASCAAVGFLALWGLEPAEKAPELVAYYRESGAFEEHEVRKAMEEAAAAAEEGEDLKISAF